MPDIIFIPLNKLVRSPRNVRKTGGESVEELAASIFAHGLLHNLTVTEHQNQKGSAHETEI
ncbi:MAG TPA: ParB N-terminal domain-containing protein [Acidobacteriaceae bacterium]|jgi:ParB family chromosome partitioning protein